MLPGNKYKTSRNTSRRVCSFGLNFGTHEGLSGYINYSVDKFVLVTCCYVPYWLFASCYLGCLSHQRQNTWNNFCPQTSFPAGVRPSPSTECPVRSVVRMFLYLWLITSTELRTPVDRLELKSSSTSDSTFKSLKTCNLSSTFNINVC